MDDVGLLDHDDLAAGFGLTDGEALTGFGGGIEAGLGDLDMPPVDDGDGPTSSARLRIWPAYGGPAPDSGRRRRGLARMVLAGSTGHELDMSRRSRIMAFGGAGLLLLAGVACGAAIPGAAGEVLALVLAGIGLVAAVSFVFYEVGLSEDRERARLDRMREAGSRAPRTSRADAGPRPQPMRRLGRMRGHPRRLR